MSFATSSSSSEPHRAGSSGLVASCPSLALVPKFIRASRHALRHSGDRGSEAEPSSPFAAALARHDDTLSFTGVAAVSICERSAANPTVANVDASLTLLVRRANRYAQIVRSSGRHIANGSARGGPSLFGHGKHSGLQTLPHQLSRDAKARVAGARERYRTRSWTTVVSQPGPESGAELTVGMGARWISPSWCAELLDSPSATSADRAASPSCTTLNHTRVVNFVVISLAAWPVSCDATLRSFARPARRQSAMAFLASGWTIPEAAYRSAVKKKFSNRRANRGFSEQKPV
jgi:hypothetical protein